MARRFGARAIRVPREPLCVIQCVENRNVTATSLAFGCCARWLRSQVRHAGLFAPDAVFGVAWSGEFTADRLLSLLRHLPGGAVEIYMHPATENRFAGSAPGYRYLEELKALCAAEVLAEIRRARLEPVGYSDVVEKVA
jgi:hypothetical protein